MVSRRNPQPLPLAGADIFAATAYYPALLGACGLGKWIFNQFGLTRRADFREHESTAAVASKQSFND